MEAVAVNTVAATNTGHGGKIALVVGSIAAGLVILYLVLKPKKVVRLSPALKQTPLAPSFSNSSALDSNDDTTYQKMVSTFADADLGDLSTITQAMTQYVSGGNLENLKDANYTVLYNGKITTPASGAFLKSVILWNAQQGGKYATLVNQLKTIFNNYRSQGNKLSNW